MVGRLKVNLLLALAAVLVAPALVQAQDNMQGRMRVLIPYFEPMEGAKNNFGKDASKDLRELISTLATHEAIEEKEIKDEAKRFDLKIDDLNCISSRQLASQITAGLALCASYTMNPDKSWNVSAAFWATSTGESFEVTDITVGEKGREEAAQHIFNEFDLYVQQIRAVGICADYAASQQWENALRNCDEALALNPTSPSTIYQRARILYEMERYPESLEGLEAVLAVNPYHEDALQLAGYISAVTDDDANARRYYEQYLEMNPGNAAIRMRIAYDLAQAGDPLGAMQFIQVGLDVEPDNVDLLEQYGGFAFSAAIEAEQVAAMNAQDAGGVPPEAQEFYRQAIGAYTQVFETKGAETPVGHLRNIVAANIKLDDLGAAIAMGERVLETHAQEDALWSIYADALQREGRVDDAIAAIDRVLEINPAYPSAQLRQGNWLIEAGRVEDAVEVLKAASAGNPAQAEQAARMIFADAYQNGYQQDRFQYAITGMSAAKELPGVSEDLTNQLNFWHGFSIYQMAVKEQETQTLATAQSSLPKFRQAMGLLQQAGDYPSSVNVNMTQLMENANTFVEIQEAIIKRGG